MSDRPTRDCQCKRANHQHGTRTAYVVDRCRCDPCREAARIYEAQRRRTHLYGRYNNLVDAEPARQHLRTLRAHGMSHQQLETLTGVDKSTLFRILHGRTERGEGPARRIIPKNADAILAVRFTHEGLPGGHQIPATGAIRRAQALACLGYTFKWQAEQIGMSPANYARIVRTEGGKVTVTTHGLIDDLYRRYEMTPNRPETWHEKAAASRARNTATREGWAPPAAWDDIDLDDRPASTPAYKTISDMEARRQDAVDLIAGGYAPATVMGRLGIRTLRDLKLMLATAGRADLAEEAALAHQVWQDAA